MVVRDRHLVEQGNGSLTPFRYYFAQREAVAVKVIDIFGNDTMTLVRLSVG